MFEYGQQTFHVQQIFLLIMQKVKNDFFGMSSTQTQINACIKALLFCVYVCFHFRSLYSVFGDEIVFPGFILKVCFYFIGTEICILRRSGCPQSLAGTLSQGGAPSHPGDLHTVRHCEGTGQHVRVACPDRRGDDQGRGRVAGAQAAFSGLFVCVSTSSFILKRSWFFSAFVCSFFVCEFCREVNSMEKTAQFCSLFSAIFMFLDVCCRKKYICIGI